MYINVNPNPHGIHVGDCVVRAIAIVLGEGWDKTYFDLCLQGYLMKDMPSANHVWGSYLKDKGFQRLAMPESLPDFYSVKDFCIDNPIGIYILATGSHVVAVIDGNYYDAWDSGDEVPIYIWRR